MKWSAIVGFSGLLLMVATVAFVFWMYGRDPSLPDYRKLADYKPKQVTTIVDKDGHRLGEIFTERRTFVPYEKLPPHVVNAFVAAEDNKFWQHEGVDYYGMFRAFWANIRAGKKTQGASTITQQVVKTFLLTPERTFKRKIQEIILARRLEKSLSKEEIMTLYVNQIYFGHGRYGIQEASRYFFGKDVDKITVAEAAVLAGMPKEPEVIANALIAKKLRPKERQMYVLGQMVKIGKLTQPEAQKAMDAPIQVVATPFPYMNTAPEWVELAKKELIAERGEATLTTLGATVRVTVDPTMHANAQKALQTGLRALDKRHKVGRAARTVKPEKIDAAIAALTKKLPSKGPAKSERYDAVVTAVHDEDNEVVVDLGGYQASLMLGGADDTRFNPPDEAGNALKPSERFKRGDVVEVMAAAADKKAAAPKHAKQRVTFGPGAEGAIVILELKTRKVRALVGGYASRVAGFNRATQAHRQPGSSFKPFVYAAGLELGAANQLDQGGARMYTAASSVNDAPDRIEQWIPKNYESGKFAGDVLLRFALSKSINTVAIRMMDQMEKVKAGAVGDMARRAGISSKLPTTLSLALGSGEVTPLEMTNAIATFGAGGIAAKPRFVDAIDGKATPPAVGEQAVKPEIAYVITDMMRSVVTSGTAAAANKLKLTIAGKTGTSNDARDVWFIGMTPDYAIGVWIGYDDNRPMGRETGGTTAVPVFVDVAKTMGLQQKSFPRPAKIVEAKIDRQSGKLAPEGFPKNRIMTEVFVQGTAPTEVAPNDGDVTGDNLVQGEYDELPPEEPEPEAKP
ncbi:MAG: PBP1A family penicillin-binding protein [Kofleriaceae bacterium]